ncbi:unnamed protein product [Caenorhabditis angaria]|uniref:Uncharacterized protein n=1 Tax=Caenorhabditis angaria TaxID=860376 RepID=A0A9P1N5N2_9PELO|nr:unnamed protein product [Caenorhabditis angaria]
MSVFLTVFLYSVTSSLFFPVFQSLVFFKSCISIANSTDPNYCYDREASAKNEAIHTLSNMVLLVSSSGLCITAFFTSRYVGRLSDIKSRKLALLIPFFGLILADLSIIVQVVIPEIPPYFFILSEIIFGLFGGYMSITSCAFAIISSYHKDPRERAKVIARMEGNVAFGSMVGFLISSQLDRTDYLGMCGLILIAHIGAFISAMFVKDEPKISETNAIQTSNKPSIFTSTSIFTGKSYDTKKSLCILYFSFALSYFAFIDTTLAIFGLVTRSIGRAWYAFAWNDIGIYSVVFFEMFSKFPATSLRSLISTNVAENERGAAFALVAVIEAFCNLTSSVIFHGLFPLTISFCPELSFYVMPLIIVPAIILMGLNRKMLEHPTKEQLAEIREAAANEKPETERLTENVVA